MTLLQPFSMAVKSMLRNKGRSILTMLGIIIGVCAVIVLVSLMDFTTKQSIEQMLLMGANRIDIGYYSSRDISKDLYDYINANDELFEGVTPSVQAYQSVKYLSKSSEMTVFYGSNQYDICNNYSLTEGSMFSAEQVNTRARVAVIGGDAKKKLFGYINPIGKEIRVGGEKFTVVGVFESKYDLGDSDWSPDTFVLLPYTRQRTVEKRESIDGFVVKATSAETTTQAIDMLNSYLKDKLGNDWQFYVYTNNNYVEDVTNQTRTMSLVLGGIAGISLLVGGIGIMNIMLVSVTERTKEIGIRRAIGAKRGDIVSQFLIESGTISALGGIIGILFGVFLTLVLGKLIFNDIVLPSLVLGVGAVLFSMAIGVFFGFYPAFRASKLRPIEALRSE